MVQSKITVSSVGIGEAEGQPLMQRIAKRGGGRYHFVANMKKLPRIFIHESLTLKRSLIFEETFVPAIADRGDDFLQDIGAALPPLYGYVATTAKAGAHVPLVSANENKDPILAHWRYGFGQAVAFTSDAKNRWGKDWLSWEGYGPFWTGAVHRILREPPANLRLALTIEGQTGKIVGQAMDDSGRPLSFLEIEAAVTSPDGAVSRLRLRQTGVGIYEGEFPAEKSGRYEVAAASAATANMPPCFAYAGVARPFNAESENLAPDRHFLEQLASRGGGRILRGEPAQDDLFSAEGLALPPSRDERWALLLALAAILLPLDVFSRRVMVDYAELKRWLTAAGLRLRRKPLPREERLGRLLSAKQRAIATSAPRAAAAMPAPTPASESSAAPAPPPAMEKETRDSATAYTGRLLQAKQRARFSQEGK
ncbi:MAG: glutamine amidotransferase [Planctomycetota bacterium]|nr:glutamine amidotransferase [Planctomycetota bacterium]